MENTILVSYDLMVPGKDYEKLRDHLRSYPSWAKPLESLWLLKTEMNAEQVNETVMGYIDKNDKLFTIDVTGKEAAWYNLSQKISEWIKGNI